MVPERKRSPEEEQIRRADRRWFVVAALVFAGSFAGLLGASELYRATGPHPQLVVFIRRVKFYANSLLRQGRLRRSQ
jgi:hypothetical protein